MVFSQRRFWRITRYMIWCFVQWTAVTDVSNEHITLILKGNQSIFRNVGNRSDASQEFGSIEFYVLTLSEPARYVMLWEGDKLWSKGNFIQQLQVTRVILHICSLVWRNLHRIVETTSDHCALVQRHKDDDRTIGSHCLPWNVGLDELRTLLVQLFFKAVSSALNPLKPSGYYMYHHF
jgi:hypothetical protein